MKSETKQIVILGVSFLVGVMAFVVTHMYLRKQLDDIMKRKQELESGRDMIKVVAAARTLARGTTIAMEDLGERTARKRDVGGTPVLPEEYNQIIGRKLLVHVERDQPILWSAVDTPFRPGSGLAPTIRKRLRAVSVSVGGASAVSGLVQPNDRVDVIGTFTMPGPAKEGSTQPEMQTVTMTVLQNVTVLAVGTQMATAELGVRSQRQAQGYSTVTLEVSPKEVELLVFAEHMRGRLTLSLRNPTDMNYLQQQELQNVNFDDLATKIPAYNEVRQKEIIEHGVRTER